MAQVGNKNETHSPSRQAVLHTLAKRAVSLHKVRAQEDVKELCAVIVQILHRVVNGQHMHAVAVLDVRAGVDGHNIAQAHAQICADNLVHADLFPRAIVLGQHNADLRITVDA